MSHIGMKEIRIPDNVSVHLIQDKISIKGVNGILHLALNNIDIDIITENKNTLLNVKPRITGNKKSDKNSSLLWGTYRTLIDNMVIGVSRGYRCSLELVGVGYKANMVDKNKLSLKIGYSIDIVYMVPSDVNVECPKPTIVEVFGIDKQRVYQVAAHIRAFRQPEPYKGKGIRYAGEKIHLKEGKKK